MSIRQFSPRLRSRRGLSPIKRFLLLSVLLIAVALQISYPLLDGSSDKNIQEWLRLVTIATVYWGAGAMCLHAWFAYGFGYAISYLSITFTFALIVEQIGGRTGWPFGNYSYDGSLGYFVYGVPLVVPFAWVMLAHPLLIAARRISKHWVFLVGGFGLMAWDIFLDPQMVNANRWTWEFDGPAMPYTDNIPLSNSVGWLLSGMGLMAILHALLPLDRRKSGSLIRVIDFFLLWSWFSGIVGNLFFFDRPGIALLGGVAFGLIVLPYFFNRRFGPPAEL